MERITIDTDTGEKTYTASDCVAFCEAALGEGCRIEHYHGRFCWEGPAVRTDKDHDVHDLVAMAKEAGVPVKTDQMGMGHIVYPVVSDNGEEVGR